MNHRLLALSVLGLIGCDPNVSPVAETELEIVNGTTDTGDPAVVGLEMWGGYYGWTCTGTLVSPKVVLTAAHCIDEDGPGGPSPALSGVNVCFGTYMTSCDYTRSGSSWQYHPGWTGDASSGNDIALIALSSAAPSSINPIPFNRTSLYPTQINKPIKLVGFGITSYEGTGDGTKRTVGSTLFGAYGSPALTEFGSSSGNTCQGDSGGPELMTISGVQTIVSVTSFGVAPFCTSGYSYGTDVSYYLDFIDDYISAHDTVLCTADGMCKTGCTTGPDPDCPCIADGFCSTLCTDTSSDIDCDPDCVANGICISDAGRCATPDPDCGPSCGADGTCVTTCTTHDPDCPLGGIGAACTSSDECESGTCLPALDDTRLSFCTDLCDSVACPDTMVCRDVGDGGAFCYYPGPSPGALGYPCSTSEECRSGICLDYCIELCPEGTCAGGYVCQAAAGGEPICLKGEPTDDDGWCAVAPGARGGALGGLVLALGLVLLRRRR